MVRGIGIDILSVDEFEERLRRVPALKERLFTERELKLSYSLESLAGRFALKEAVLKALGTGLTGGIRWRDVEIVGGVKEPPRVVLHGKARSIAGDLTLHVSLSHSAGIVVGVCVVTSSDT